MIPGRRAVDDGSGQAAAVSSRASAASTTSSCVFGDALAITWATRPSASMRNVVRLVPQDLLPYVDLRRVALGDRRKSSSASSVKLRSRLSWKRLMRATGSGQTPSTVAPAAS
jgi:hypothetical protein